MFKVMRELETRFLSNTSEKNVDGLMLNSEEGLNTFTPRVLLMLGQVGHTSSYAYTYAYALLLHIKRVSNLPTFRVCSLSWKCALL